MSQGEIFSATPLDIQTCLNAYGYNQYFFERCSVSNPVNLCIAKLQSLSNALVNSSCVTMF